MLLAKALSEAYVAISCADREAIMEKYILSIYVPTFNRAEYLAGLLENIYNEISFENKDLVEVVVSDNASPDNTEETAKELCQRYAEAGRHFKYHRNSENIGGCRNYLQCTDYLNGEWCWLVGDDDMILKGGISTIVDTICADSAANGKLNYYCINYAYVTMKERNEYLKDTDKQKYIPKEMYFFQNTEIKLLDNWSELFMLDSGKPTHIGTFLGGNLFRSKMWAQMRNKVDYEKPARLGVDNHEEYRLSADYVFPHLVIAGKACMNEQIGYIGLPCIGLGTGAQENSATNWKFIESFVFDDLFDLYCECGMTCAAQEKYKDSFASKCGSRIAELFAGKGVEGISLESTAEYIVKYGNNREFLNNFLEGVAVFTGPPIKAKYDVFVSELFRSLILPYIDQNMRIALWGAGDMARSILTYCQELCGHVAVVVDGNPRYCGQPVKELPGCIIQSPEILKTEAADMVLITSLAYADEIVKQIEEMGIKTDVISCKGKMTIGCGT